MMEVCIIVQSCYNSGDSVTSLSFSLYYYYYTLMVNVKLLRSRQQTTQLLSYVLKADDSVRYHATSRLHQNCNPFSVCNSVITRHEGSIDFEESSSKIIPCLSSLCQFLNVHGVFVSSNLI
mmetsp:Transcript_11606/g.19120  ORF Transcript_11606/g.19120 Transcript_11606/m.19120 type:complete len:121 (-) Transcript_11606:2262-2624(-)